MGLSFIQMAQACYREEVNDALTYRVLAENAKDATLRTSIVRIARMEQDHAAFWQGFLASKHAALPQPRLSKGRLACLHQTQSPPVWGTRCTYRALQLLTRKTSALSSL